MLRFVRDLSPRSAKRWVWLGGLAVLAVISGCSPATTHPIGATGSVVPAASMGSGQPSNWSAVAASIHLGLRSDKYQEKVTVNISQGSIVGGFSVYGRVNPPNKVSLLFHQNGFNPSFYQQGLSAYGQLDHHWQQEPAIADLNVFPSYAQLTSAAMAADVPVTKFADAQYVVDEYCTVYQATIPGSMISTLPTLVHQFRPDDTSAVVYTFYVGQNDHQLRQVTTSSVGAVTGVGSIQIQTDTILFAINQSGSEISIDQNLYNALLYQY